MISGWTIKTSYDDLFKMLDSYYPQFNGVELTNILLVCVGIALYRHD
jgi:hypothetical protein